MGVTGPSWHSCHVTRAAGIATTCLSPSLQGTTGTQRGNSFLQHTQGAGLRAAWTQFSWSTAAHFRVTAHRHQIPPQACGCQIRFLPTGKAVPVHLQSLMKWRFLSSESGARGAGRAEHSREQITSGLWERGLHLSWEQTHPTEHPSLSTRSQQPAGPASCHYRQCSQHPHNSQDTSWPHRGLNLSDLEGTKDG